MTRPKVILSQGDLDGACFLYSLTNAALCLGLTVTEEQLKRRWASALDVITDPVHYLNSKKGTAGNRSAACEQELAIDFLHALAPNRFDVELLDTSINLLHIARKHLNAETVLVVDNGAHWFCVVDIDGSTLHAACSARWNETPPYHEWRTTQPAQFNRWANVELRRAPPPLRALGIALR